MRGKKINLKDIEQNENSRVVYKDADLEWVRVSLQFFVPKNTQAKLKKEGKTVRSVAMNCLVKHSGLNIKRETNTSISLNSRKTRLTAQELRTNA